MRILLTGASGFIGSWTAPALLTAGHDVVALVRDPEKARRVLGQRGLADGDVELRQGDILDAPSVASALDGCEGAIHAAAAIGVTSGGQVPVLEQNVTGTRNVVGQALDAGCDPVVHLSTVAAFVPPDAPVITTESRLASPRNDYGRSKVIAERELRARQDAGEPVTIVYPGGVLGPDQPQLDATLEGIAGARRQGWPLAPGGVCLVDVRDLAALLTAAMEPGRGPRRFMAGGTFLSWPDLGDLTDDIIGVKARRVPFPKPLLYATGSFLDLLRKRFTIAYPLTRDAAEIMVTMVPTDDSATVEQLGVQFRPVRESLTDALTWLVREGHLNGKAAGNLATGGSG